MKTATLSWCHKYKLYNLSSVYLPNDSNHIYLIIGITLCFISPHASAVNWRFTPSLAVDTHYSDNPHLVQDDPQHDTWYSLTPKFSVQSENAIQSLSWLMSYRALRYRHRQQNNVNEIQSAISFSQTTQSAAWGLGVQYNLTENRTQALDDTGRADIITDRQLSSITPTFRYQYSPILALKFSLAATEVRYLDVTDNSLADYNNDQITATAEQKLSINTQMSYRLIRSRYRTKISGIRVDKTELQLSVARDISATFSLNFMLGGNHNKHIQPQTDESTERGFVGGIEFNWAQQSSRWKGSINSSVNASGLGTVQQQDTVQLQYTQKISPHVGLQVSATMAGFETIFETDESQNRQYNQLKMELNWNMSTESSIIFSYHFTRQTTHNVTESQTARENNVHIGYHYQY